MYIFQDFRPGNKRNKSIEPKRIRSRINRLTISRSRENGVR
mgnify:CR=1 FL=1